MVFGMLKHINMYIQNIRLPIKTKRTTSKKAKLKIIAGKDPKSHSPIYIYFIP